MRGLIAQGPPDLPCIRSKERHSTMAAWAESRAGPGSGRATSAGSPSAGSMASPSRSPAPGRARQMASTASCADASARRKQHSRRRQAAAHSAIAPGWAAPHWSSSRSTAPPTDLTGRSRKPAGPRYRRSL